MSKLDPRIAMTDGAKAAAAMAKIGLLRKTDSAAIDAVVKMLTTMIVEAAVQCGRANGLNEAAELVRRVSPSSPLLADEIEAQAEHIERAVEHLSNDVAKRLGEFAGSAKGGKT
jgi:flagellar biosynthesis/type III secretory pathway protein FliH